MKEVVYTDFETFLNVCDTSKLFVCELVFLEDVLSGCTEFSYNVRYDKLTVKINGIVNTISSVGMMMRLHNLDNGVYVLSFEDYIVKLNDKGFRKRVYGYERINTVIIHQYICTKFLFWLFRHVDVKSVKLLRGYSTLRLEELCDMLMSNIRNAVISFNGSQVVFKLDAVTFSFERKNDITEEEFIGKFAKYQALEVH